MNEPMSAHPSPPSGSGVVTRLYPDWEPPSAVRAWLTPWQRMEVESARELLSEAGELLDVRPHAYVAGLLQGCLANLLDIIDVTTEAGA